MMAKPSRAGGDYTDVRRALDMIRAEKQRREADTALREAEKRGDEIRDECKRLSGFIRNAWHVLEPATPYVHGWHIDVVCDHLEAITDGNFTRLLINMPPGTMKSLLTNVFWNAWEWGPKHLAHHRFIGTAHKIDLATRDSRRTLSLVQSPWFQSLWPHVELIKAGETYFDNTRTGWRKPMAFTSMTGERGDRVVVDDPHSVKKAESDVERNAVIRDFRESLPSRINDALRSAIVVIMQRLHAGDVSGEILSKKYGYIHLMLPMEFERKRRCVTYLPGNDNTPLFEDPRTEENDLLFPEKFPREVVERDKSALGIYASAGQFQQRPTPRTGGLFLVDRLKIVRAPRAPIVKSIRYWDKAGTQDGGKYSAGVLMHRLADNSYLIGHVVRGQWSAGKREAHISLYAKLDGPGVMQWIEQEPGSGGKESAESTIINNPGHSFRADRVTGDKVTRADPLAVQIEAFNVDVIEAPWTTDLIDEMRLFPRGQFKDQCDAAAGAFSKLAGAFIDYDALNQL